MWDQCSNEGVGSLGMWGSLPSLCLPLGQAGSWRLLLSCQVLRVGKAALTCQGLRRLFGPYLQAEVQRPLKRTWEWKLTCPHPSCLPR